LSSAAIPTNPSGIPVVTQEALEAYEKTSGLEGVAEFLISTGRVRLADFKQDSGDRG
jgi:hypothetical protein